jgi:hypothetical protein
VKQKIGFLALWTALAGGLNLVWEIIQLPLYTIYYETNLQTIAYAVAHCTLGDALIALSSYLLSAAATRSWNWPVDRVVPGAAVAVVAGLTYTALSEWLNVSVRGSWAYAPAMPQLFGLGLSPLLQWLVLPLFGLLIFRALERRMIDLNQIRTP